MTSIPIIDTHQHIWDLSRFDLAWHAEEPFTRLARNYLLDDYELATANLPIEKTIYMEVDVAQSQQDAEVECVIDLCGRDDNRMAAAVIDGKLGTEQFAQQIKRYRNSPFIKGVRDILFEQLPGHCLGEDFIRDVRLLGELGMSFGIETPAEGLPEAAQLVAACPNTQFILDHCGNPVVRSGDVSAWRNNVAAVAGHENVVAKVSGLFTWVDRDDWSTEQLAPIIQHLLGVFGPDRVMFGSDWPVVTIVAPFSRWVEVVQNAISDRSEEDQRKLFHDNAERVYRLA